MIQIEPAGNCKTRFVTSHGAGKNIYLDIVINTVKLQAVTGKYIDCQRCTGEQQQ